MGSLQYFRKGRRMIGDSGFLSGFIRSKAAAIGKELGERCRYWCDDEIYESITHESKEKQFSLREKYLEQCHEPEVCMRVNPTTSELDVQVICRSCSPRLPNDCRRVFPKIAEKMKDILKESMNAIGEEKYERKKN